MSRGKEFDNILDKCLERVLFKGEPVQQCLASYPEYAAELEPLLRTALETKEAAAIKPRPQFRQRAGHEFQAALRETGYAKRRESFTWGSRWATAVVVVLALLLVSTGTVAAASISMPDEPLYPVKLATESVQLALTLSDVDKAELHVKLADIRIAEIVRMADEGKTDKIERTTERLNSDLIAVSRLAAPEAEGIALMQAAAPAPEAASPRLTGETPATIQATEPATGENRSSIQAVPPPAVTVPPQPAAPGLSKAPPKAAERSANATSTSDNVTYGEVKKEKVDKETQELKQLLTQRAAETPGALEKALEKAPASAKPALRHAIEVAGNGYQQALNRLDK